MKKIKVDYSAPATSAIVYQSIFLITMPIYLFYASPSWGIYLATFVLYCLTGVSIMAGYHRLYSHSSYSAHPILDIFFLFFGSMAMQGSAIRWAYDHRLHHAYVDTESDPHSIKHGFLYAHFLWLMETPRPIEKRVVRDHYERKLLVFQNEHITLCMVVTNLIAFLIIGLLLDDFLGALMLATLTRLFILHHSTWFINSLAHTWGTKPWRQELSATNNFIVALLTFGEGYHNYHHAFPKDYRNGICWFHFDPAKWFIWLLSKLGLAKNLRVVVENNKPIVKKG